MTSFADEYAARVAEFDHNAAQEWDALQRALAEYLYEQAEEAE